MVLVEVRMRAVVAALLCATVAAGTAADTYPRQPAVDAIHYRFAVTLTPGVRALTGDAVATFRLIAPAAEIALDLKSVDGDSGMRVSAVTSAGKPIAFSHANDRLRLPVPAEVRPGDDVSYTITYGGAPRDSLRFLTNMHGEPVVFSEGWPNRARHWLPMIDHPYDKATGELIVTAPSDYQVVSNGVLVEEVDLGRGQRRTHWKQSVPLASWLFALAVARFDVHHAGVVRGVPLQTWVFPQNGAAGRAVFEETSRRALTLFADRIGPYPYEKLANVQAAGFGGGMENATVIFYGEKGVASGRAPVVHEIAHQWFGNSITERDWDDVWLSEGFASYFTHLYTEHFEGRDEFVRDLRDSRADMLALESKLPDTPIIHRNLSDMARVLNGLVYQKAAWVLHMLRGEIGTEAFWRGIREYYARYRDRNASTEDFRQVMEQAAGRDLEWFFSQWLRRGGAPRLQLEYSYQAARKALDVRVRQTQPGMPFRLGVDIGVTTPDGRTRVQRVLLQDSEAAVSMPLDAAPTDVRLDPETWLYAEFSTSTSSAPR
jgi:aminopeptidase N